MLSTLALATLSSNRVSAATVLVDSAIRYQTMDGFGSSERVFDDPHVFDNFNPATGRAATVMTTAQQEAVLDRLYTDLKLTRVRPANPDNGSGMEAVNDNNDPNVTDLSKFNFSWKNLDAHVDYITRARERGANNFFLSPLGREPWMGTTTANDAAEYSEWLFAQVKRSADRGVRLPFLSVANEPSYSRNTMSGQFIRDVIKNLGPRLRADGFETQFVTPDDVRSSDGASKAAIILADPIARQYVGALATHLYDESVHNVAQMKALADQYGLPLWMTEFTAGAMGTAGLPQNAFSWGSLMHDLISNYDVSAVDYLWGSFGEWEGNATTLISLNNTGAAYDGYTLNKTYYTTGQFSRFIEPGAERIKAESSDAGVQTTAYLSDSELVLVAINTDSASKEITFDLSGIPAEQFARIRTSLIENWATLPSIAVSGSTLTATLPGNSIETFVASIPAIVAGDFSENWVINAADLALWRTGFGTNGEASHMQGDADGDRDVDGADFLVWQRDLGDGVSIVATNAAVPEPTAMALLAIGSLALLCRSMARPCPKMVFDRERA
ncbi:MAG: hypothetical protein H0T51_26205 [Pirellulales bacterium]|nr:hypothetical protein [Pirellulales bacterium]